ncbi:MAG: hypothetical protein BroJett025_07720 [Patescibacteria group bacterium]|nr:MAG: hypothetical protein BroJett025_07720 [Patescibacteria group bacterium]
MQMMRNPEHMGMPIAFGRESEIFDIGIGKILKLYSAGFPKEKIAREFQNVQAVSRVVGDLVPHAVEQRVVNGRHGIVFEKISGKSFMDLFQEKPVLYFTQSEVLANIARKIHSFEVAGVPTQLESFSELIQSTNRLTKQERAVLMGLLKKSKAKKLCHGDFHHGNVIKTDEGRIVVIDWMDAFVGDPALDIALTAVNAMVSDAPAHIPQTYRLMYELLKKVLRLDKKVIKRYPEISQQRMKEAIVLAAGIHLARKEGDFREHRKYFDLAITIS